MADNIFSKVKESASALKDKVSDLRENIWGDEQKQIIQEFKDSGTSKIKEVLENIGGSSAIFLQSGYELKNVSINLGLPPDIVTTFQFIKDISEEEQKRVLDETKKSSIIHLIITCLLKASNYFDKIKVGDYKMSSVSISLGLTPGININFTK
jgi:hypothetical protein